MASATWLLNRGLEIGSVIVDAESWKRAEADAPTHAEWERYQGSNVFMQGDTRPWSDFLPPAAASWFRSTVLRGKLIDVEWGGGHLQMVDRSFPSGTAGKRRWSCRSWPLMTACGATAYTSGARARAHDSSGDDEAAANHVARELFRSLRRSRSTDDDRSAAHGRGRIYPGSHGIRLRPRGPPQSEALSER